MVLLLIYLLQQLPKLEFSFSTFLKCLGLNMKALRSGHGHTMARFQFFVAEIQIPIPNKLSAFGFEGLILGKNNGSLIENMDIGTHSTKMGADKSAKNTPNVPKFICPICLPKPKR